MICQTCGYHKNDPGQAACGLCGSVLGAEAHRGGGEPEEHSFGRDRGAERGAKKAVKTKNDGPSEDQIVYAGDFAIVYAFVLSAGGLLILKPSEVFTFGRGDAADHRIDARTVSRRHARIHWSGVDPPIPELVDLDSKNGIVVNGVPVKRRTLEDGDEVQIGPFAATLRVLSANDDLQSQVTADPLSATQVDSERLSGEIPLVSIPGLLCHLERQKESGTLWVQHEAVRGYVTLISGVAIAAAFGRELEVEGEDAIRHVGRLKQGRFAFSQRADATPQSIARSISQLLAPESAAGAGPPRGAPPGPNGPAGSGGPGRRRPPPPPAPRGGRRPPPPARPTGRPPGPVGPPRRPPQA